MIVIGPPGTGKSTLLQAIKRGYAAEAKKVIILAEYNTQVTELVQRFGHGPRTRAGFFAIPENEPATTEDMEKGMAESYVHAVTTAHALLEDEFALSTPRRMTACNAVLQSIRNNGNMWGGLDNIKFGDPFQGGPILSEREREEIPGSSVAGRCTITTEGAWFDAERVRVMVLDEYVRFREPRFIAGHKEIMAGPAAIGDDAEYVRAVASAKRFSDDLYVHTALGSNYVVMKAHNGKQWRRAERRSATKENGQVVHFKDERAVGCSRELLKFARGFGFEENVFVLGERHLITVKERDPEQPQQPLKVGKKFVTNLTGATLINFGFDRLDVLRSCSWLLTVLVVAHRRRR